ncbi:MAG: sarcosine oxidase subunit gamma family protein [Hyphomicrobiales bacterium]
MAEPEHRSALHGAGEPDGLALRIWEMPPRGMIDLRGDAGSEAFRAGFKQVTGVDLPLTPRASAAWGEIKILWLSIDQWLVICPRSRLGELTSGLKDALKGQHVAITDVSDMRAVIRLEGDGVREVLLKGCSLDLLGKGYEPGTVRRVRFAEIAALIQVIDAQTIELYVFRSYAHYAWEFLTVTARAAAQVKLFGEQPVPAV